MKYYFISFTLIYKSGESYILQQGVINKHPFEWQKDYGIGKTILNSYQEITKEKYDLYNSINSYEIS